jgi:hypothetical protein
MENQFKERIRQKEMIKKKKKKKLEPTIDYKYPPIALGATYIKSTGGAPNDKGPTS